MKKAIEMFQLRTIFLFVVGLGVVGGVVLSTQVDDLYEGKAAIRIGSISVYPADELVSRSRMSDFSVLETRTRFLNTRMIEIPQYVCEELRASYQVSDARNGSLSLPYLYDVRMRDGGVISLVARGNTVAQTKEFLNDILQDIVQRHDDLYDAQHNFINAQLEMLGEELRFKEEGVPQFLIELIDSLKERNVDLWGESATATATNLLLMFREFGEAIMPMAVTPTRIILEPYVNQEKLQPKPTLYLVTGGFLGVIVATLLVIVLKANYSQILRVFFKQN